jgi:hypothetical protein
MAIEKPELYQHPPQAIHEFVVEDMPVTVAVNTQGESIHQIAPKIWQKKSARFLLLRHRSGRRSGPDNDLLSGTG